MAHAGEIEFPPVFAMVSQKRGVIGGNREEQSWAIALDICVDVFRSGTTGRKNAGRAHAELDQFNLEPGDDLTPEALGVKPGNVLVMVRNYNTMHPLRAVLNRVEMHEQDIVVLHLRFLERAGSGEYDVTPEQLFSIEEQELFTRALALAEKEGKPIHLAVAAANEKWDAILRSAQSLQSSMVVLGASPARSI